MLKKASSSTEINCLKDNFNEDSLKVLKDCRLEPSLAGAGPGDIYQFERLGYFCVDADSTADEIIFNRSVTLKDKWAKIKSSQQK